MSSLSFHAPRGFPSLLLPRPLATGNRETLPSGALWNRGSTSRLPHLRSSSLRRVRSFEDSANGPLIPDDEEVKDVGVRLALSMLRFYKREISPLLPSSCRYVPTCSEYSMQAYKKYGVAKGTVLTAWRLCRCNPLGGSGFDPPRWFDEDKPIEDL